ncbi:MAG: hypothetical protein WA006_03380 [Rhodoglobus sp.]
MSVSALSRVDLRRGRIERSLPEEPSIALLREDLYCVLSTTHTMGFVERVGNVYVALHGSDLGRAVEVGQSLSWDVAVAMVDGAHRARG